MKIVALKDNRILFEKLSVKYRVHMTQLMQPDSNMWYYVAVHMDKLQLRVNNVLYARSFICIKDDYEPLPKFCIKLRHPIGIMLATCFKKRKMVLRRIKVSGRNYKRVRCLEE